VIVGTAGHIDHGKTALVRALTGVDTDRLPEEKRRGITIELGFAPLALDGVGVAGVVDVPGHEAFVRTMLAGATGVDVALLVVAADEGVMPQTREHLAILDLLGVRAGVVALTKCDLVDDEWRELVADDVRATLAGTVLADAPVVATSATRGTGLPELRAALAAALRALPGRDAADLFRMPVDRAFTVRGTGTVVTGTVWSGTLARDAHAVLLPHGRAVRVRALQSHGAAVAAVGPGTRAAVALVGVEVAEAPRGAVLVADERWTASAVLRADVRLLADAPAALGPRTRVLLHLGTQEVAARLVAEGGALAPGGRAAVRVVAEVPVVARAGDRLVLRALSPLTTIGGGVVTDPAPPRARVRPWPGVAHDPGARLLLALDEAGVDGVPERSLAVRLGLAPHDVARLVDGASVVVRLGEQVVARAHLDALAASLLERVEARHRDVPLEPGQPLQPLRAALGAPAVVTDAVLADLVGRGRVAVDGALVRRAGWVPQLSAAQRAAAETLQARVTAAGLEPPSLAELAVELGRDVPALVALGERAGLHVALEPDRPAARSALDAAVLSLDARLARGDVYAPGAIREALGISRRFVMPLLEWMDREGITDRRPDGRLWRGPRQRAGDPPAA
jgi:selenocysteine-specific elongation factor